jgi:phage-related holin
MVLAAGYVYDVLDAANIDNGCKASTKKITNLAMVDIVLMIRNVMNNLPITDNTTIIANNCTNIKIYICKNQL